jgi:hypothetical protein
VNLLRLSVKRVVVINKLIQQIMREIRPVVDDVGRTLDALKQLLLREAREQALLLIFEDLHWIDGGAAPDRVPSMRRRLRANRARPAAPAAWAPERGRA